MRYWSPYYLQLNSCASFRTTYKRGQLLQDFAKTEWCRGKEGVGNGAGGSNHRHPLGGRQQGGRRGRRLSRKVQKYADGDPGGVTGGKKSELYEQ